MSLPAYLQDDDDDEDDDFIPGMEDEDEDYGSDEDDESQVDKDEIPPFLQGYLMADSTDHQTVIFKENGSFCLRSEGEIPTGWSICNPLLSRPVCFTGWISDPTKCIELQVQILEQEIVDSLDEKLLQAQHKKLESELEGENKTVTSPASVDQDQKEAALPAAKCPPARPMSGVDSKSRTYSIMGSAFRESKAISFRGVFRPATNKEDGSSLFIICTTKVENAAVATPSDGTATAAKRKRDDDSDNDDSRRTKVDYQELIDLHEDAMRHQQQRP
mmetsp:Transcript_26499/g.64581  ORF Transcript_26499/g.64581 Transcript_26499/m.64581 type:complete len:274 (+) Transcript_26499:44-865(+)